MAIKFIDSIDDQTLDAVQDDWRGGAKESGRPTRLLPNQCGRLINCILDDEDGTPKTRPGADALGGAALTAARIDRLLYFDTPSTELLLAAVSASLRKWDGANWATAAAYPFGATSIEDLAQLNQLVYVTAGAGEWNSYNPATDVWAALGIGVGNPPVGATMICAHTERLFAAGVISGVDDAIYASALGNAGAGQWSHANFQFRVGRGEGEPIRALCSAKGWWLAVGKSNSIFMVNTDPTAASAATWPVKRVARSVGVVGRRAMCNAGESLFVVAPDRSLREIVPQMDADTPFELLPPASEPAQLWFNRINWGVASKIVLHKYERWLLMACPIDGASDNNTVLAWDLRYRVPGPTNNVTFPAFLGQWTGWTPTAFETTRFDAVGERLVIGDTDGKVNKWKEDDDEGIAATYKDNADEIPTTIRTASWDFQATRNWKDGESVEIEFVDSTGPATVTAVLDGVTARTWEIATAEQEPVLPVMLDFFLAAGGPVSSPKSIDGLIEFKEMYLEITSAAGRLEVRRVGASAFLNTTRTE